MSVTLQSANLASAIVGTTGFIDLTQSFGGQGIPDYNRPNQICTVRLHNESSDGLEISLPASGDSFNLPAGGWNDCYPKPGETQIAYLVTYVVPNPPVSLLLATLYKPGETVPPMTVLGNSSVGISGNVSTSTSAIINDGNASGTNIVEATVLGSGASSVRIQNQGLAQFGGGGHDGVIDIRLPSPVVVSPPAGTGSISAYGPFQSITGYNKTIILVNGVQNTSVSTYNLTLPFAYSTFARITTTHIHTFQIFNGVTLLSTLDVITAIGSANTAQSTMQPDTWGDVIGAFNILQFPASDGSVRTGIITLEGI